MTQLHCHCDVCLHVMRERFEKLYPDNPTLPGKSKLLDMIEWMMNSASGKIFRWCEIRDKYQTLTKPGERVLVNHSATRIYRDLLRRHCTRVKRPGTKLFGWKFGYDPVEKQMDRVRYMMKDIESMPKTKELLRAIIRVANEKLNEIAMEKKETT